MRKDSQTWYIQFISISGYLLYAFNLFSCISSYPLKGTPIHYHITKTMVCFKIEMMHFKSFQKYEVIIIDKVNIYMIGKANIIGDPLWHSVVDSKLLNRSTVFPPRNHQYQILLNPYYIYILKRICSLRYWNL